MVRTLLISGDRPNFTTLAFDPDRKQLRILADYAAPYNASWVEPAGTSSHEEGGKVDRLIGLSEGEEAGQLYTFEIEHSQKLGQGKITSQQPTLGAPCHFITLRDGSALALSTYMGGSIALYPISITDADGLRLLDQPRTEIHPEFPYQSAGHGPNEGRQRQCHVHQVLEDKRGLIYASDLGSDRVWILHRDGIKLDICGWLQCPPGTGARHAVFSPDEKIIYVIGELSHTVLAFDLSTSPAKGIQPIPGFAAHIIPPSVDPKHQTMLDAAELCVHPTIPNVLYASNRWERHIAEREPNLKGDSSQLPPVPSGDTVAIILLSSDGRAVETVKHVRTSADVIRGMRLTQDGKYVVVLGQEGGGVEIYSIGGDKGDVWTRVAGLDEAVVGTGIEHAVWL